MSRVMWCVGLLFTLLVSTAWAYHLPRTSLSSIRKFSQSSRQATTHTLDGVNIASPLTPIGNQLLVRVFPPEEKLASGIYLPTEKKTQVTHGKVVSSGVGTVNEEGVLEAPRVSINQNVVFSSYEGVEVQYDEESHMLVPDSSIQLHYDGASHGDQLESLSVTDIEVAPNHVLLLLPDNKEEVKTSSGLVLRPAGTESKKKNGEGKVVNVGNCSYKNGDKISKLEVSVGDNVYYRSYAGFEFQLGQQKLLVLHISDLLAKW